MMTVLTASSWMDDPIDPTKLSSLTEHVTVLKERLQEDQLGDEKLTKKASGRYMVALENIVRKLMDLKLDIDDESETEDRHVRTDTCIRHPVSKNIWVVWEDKSYWVFENFKDKVIERCKEGRLSEANIGDTVKHEDSIIAKVCTLRSSLHRY
jgi:hypothetical protein